jgi:hypothetical protein
MLKHSFRYYVVLVSGAATLLAAGPVGSVTSTSSFLLRGIAVNVHGVPSWPLASGDDIAAGSDSAAIQLKDGSSAYLTPTRTRSLTRQAAYLVSACCPEP